MPHYITSILQDKLDDSAFKSLSDYQKATVTLLSLMSSATGNVSSVQSCIFFLRIPWCIDDDSLKVSHILSDVSYCIAISLQEEDCTSDRILSKKELLEESMPTLKSLVLGGNAQS